MGERIGVVGLGRMGAAIAARLAGLGWQVSGWTRSGRTVPGVATAPDLAACADGADILVLSLFDDGAVAEVLGALAALPLAGRLVVDTSTVSPEVLRGAEAGLRAAGAAAVDAPISGGPEMVAQGAAGMFLGGAAADVARLRPVAEALAARAPHMGPLGAGAVAKIVNNMMLAGLWQTLAEALAVGRRAGLDAETLVALLRASPATPPALTGRLDVLTGESDRVGFSVTGAVKDTRLFIDVARALGVPVPAVAASHATFVAAAPDGPGAADIAAMPRAVLTG